MLLILLMALGYKEYIKEYTSVINKKERNHDDFER